MELSGLFVGLSGHFGPQGLCGLLQNKGFLGSLWSFLGSLWGFQGTLDHRAFVGTLLGSLGDFLGLPHTFLLLSVVSGGGLND